MFLMTLAKFDFHEQHEPAERRWTTKPSSPESLTSIVVHSVQQFYFIEQTRYNMFIIQRAGQRGTRLAVSLCVQALMLSLAKTS